jgi:hypothetical protein
LQFVVDSKHKTTIGGGAAPVNLQPKS